MSSFTNPESRIPNPLFALALLLGCTLSFAQQMNPEQDARYRALINELRCLVCQNQSIADSSAPLAADLREQVRQQIEAGRTDTEIAAYLTDRYGDFVLYRPPLRPRTWLLWLGPFALLLVTAGVAAAYLRRRRQPVAAPAPDTGALRRILDEEHKVNH